MLKKATYLFIASLLFACSSNVVISKDKMRSMEVEDHNFCYDRGTNASDLDKDNQLYWECRVREAQKRVIENPETSDQKKFNKEMGNVIEVLQDRVQRSKNANLARLQDNLEDYDDDFCLMQGYSPNSADKTEVENYYICRTEAIMNRTATPPFAVSSYTYQKGELYKTQADQMPDIRNLIEVNNVTAYKGFVMKDSSVNSDIHEKALEVSELVGDYPACAKFNHDSEEFPQCVKDYKAYNDCLDEIPSKVAKRRLSDTVFCAKQSVQQFPDEMAIYKEGEEDTGPKFSRTETIKLRNEFNKRCVDDRESKLVEYANKLSKVCAESIKNWE